MFNIERSDGKKGPKCKIWGHFLAGTPLAKDDIVKGRFTYKELTLILGIFVALITAATIWSSSQPTDSSSRAINVTPNVSLPSAASIVTRSVSLMPK